MSNVAEVSTFVLKSGVSEQDFLFVSEKFNREFMSGKRGLCHQHSLKRSISIWKLMYGQHRRIWKMHERPRRPILPQLERFSLVEIEEDVPLYNLVSLLCCCKAV